VVVIILYKCCGWIDQSYALAWAGQTEIAETLSKVIAAEIVAVVVVALLKSLTENLSKNNQWPDKKPKENIETGRDI